MKSLLLLKQNGTNQDRASSTRALYACLEVKKVAAILPVAGSGAAMDCQGTKLNTSTSDGTRIHRCLAVARFLIRQTVDRSYSRFAPG